MKDEVIKYPLPGWWFTFHTEVHKVNMNLDSGVFMTECGILLLSRPKGKARNGDTKCKECPSGYY